MGERTTPLGSAKLPCLRRSLLAWYDCHRRDLPWRRDRDPYRIWVSEIMLQQTRVAAVLEHYARFMQRFPRVTALAAARESFVLATWSGLGYYHRARRMHQAAKVIVRERNGVFPRSADEWRELPGIGRYTAAAIASIAADEPLAVVDGNVERVLQRVCGDTLDGEALWRRAEAWLDRRRPGDFNQAMMELGATVCTPRAPQCRICPLHSPCATRGAESPRPQAARKSREVYYAFTCKNDMVLLVQRPADASLMAGMWELPALPASPMNGESPLLRLRHSITDTDYRVLVFELAGDRFRSLGERQKWFPRKQCGKLALTGLTRKILRRLSAESKETAPVSK